MYPYKREHYEFYRVQPRQIRDLAFVESDPVRKVDKVIAVVVLLLFVGYLFHTFA